MTGCPWSSGSSPGSPERHVGGATQSVKVRGSTSRSHITGQFTDANRELEDSRSSWESGLELSRRNHRLPQAGRFNTPWDLSQSECGRLPCAVDPPRVAGVRAIDDRADASWHAGRLVKLTTWRRLDASPPG